MEHIPFALPDVGDEEAEAVAGAIRSGWVTSGPLMREFEREFVETVGGGAEAIAVNSGTAGLHLVLEALGVGPGDEVIVPDWTFTATAEVVRYLGANPVIVDVDQVSLNMDLQATADAITHLTKAVIPVHFAGLAMDLVALRDVIADRPIAVLEDAAHALPAVGTAGIVGSGAYSDAAVFSFYATKPVTTGEGGMITTRSPEIAERSRLMRLHGIDRDAFHRYTSSQPAWSYDVVAPGFKYNMPDMAAAMGRVQLARAFRMRERRQQIADFYAAELADLPVQLPQRAQEPCLHAWHLFVIRLQADGRLHRDEFIAGMCDRGVGTSVHFIPLHQHTYWRDFVASPEATVPVAVAEAPRAVSLPISSKLTDAQVVRVVESVRALLG